MSAYLPAIEVTVTAEPGSVTLRAECFAPHQRADPFRVAPGLWCEVDRETILVHQAVIGIDGREQIVLIRPGCSVAFGPYRISVDAR